jgi:hypothetical protein
MMMIEMFTKLLAISREASRVLGSSNKFTIRLYPDCCLVFSIFTSLYDREKKATSAPETKKEISSKMMRRKIKIVEACVFITAGLIVVSNK